MSRFNLADRLSSTILFSTDNLDEMFEAVQSILQDDGLDGLEGMSLSVQSEESGEFGDYDDEEVMLALQAHRAQAWTESHHRTVEARPDRQRWLLRCIGWGQGRFPWSQIPFTKAVFLLSKSNLQFPGVDYSFEPYNYGPWDPQVTDDLNSLVKQGCLSMHPIPLSRGIEYRLTDWGRRRIESKAHEVDDAQRAAIVEIATRVTAKHYTQMLRDLYDEYPDAAKKSILK
jgi:uncharacterized protein YwgA